MKTLMIILISLISSLTMAQTTATWNGGMPGKENAWNEARNWSTNQVPDEYTKVIIMKTNTGHDAQPVIMQDVAVASIEIRTGASLYVSPGANIRIDGSETYSMGIICYGGKLYNEGSIFLSNVDGSRSEILTQLAEAGSGVLILEGLDVSTN